MSNSYIKFNVLQTGIRGTPENTGAKIEPVVTTETEIPPVSNPDFEDKIDQVATWLIEFEGDSYFPDREIGLDSSNNPIMIMPWRKNYGYWTDNDLTIEKFRKKFNCIDITREEFQGFWKSFEKKN